MPSEVGERTVLPLVDQERGRRVFAERDRGAVGDPGILDRALKVLGQVEIGVPLRGHDLDAVVLDFTGPSCSWPRSDGRSNVNTLPLPARSRR